MLETQVWSLGQEETLEKEMATHSSTLAWEIPWTEEPGRYSPWGHKRVGHDLATKQQYTELGRTHNWRVLITVPKFIKHNAHACRDEDSAKGWKGMDGQKSNSAGWRLVSAGLISNYQCGTAFSSPSLGHFFTQQGWPPEQLHRCRKGGNLTYL